MLTEAQTQRIKHAIIGKAVRFLLLPESPFGTLGELPEYGAVPVRPDFAIRELLFGLRIAQLEDEESSPSSGDASYVPTIEEVTRIGLHSAMADLPEGKTDDVERAIVAAVDWVETYIRSGYGVG